MQKKGFVFRPATLADSQSIASLHTLSWRDAYRGILPDAYLDGPIAGERAKHWQARLASAGADRRHVLVAEREGNLAAFVCVLLDEEQQWGACLDNLHVFPRLKGYGLGRHLFFRAAEWVRSQEPGWPMHLWVFEANEGARGFYEALGGEVVEHCLKQTAAGIEIASIRYVWRDLVSLLEDGVPWQGRAEK
jgi:GNAT superfamily N-acetyltransferase